MGLEEAPSAGIYIYVERGMVGIHALTRLIWLTGKISDVVFARGPQYLSSITAPSGIEESTRSASSRASRSRLDQVRVDYYFQCTDIVRILSASC